MQNGVVVSMNYRKEPMKRGQKKGVPRFGTVTRLISQNDLLS
jgi:hypothetical protein